MITARNVIIWWRSVRVKSESKSFENHSDRLGLVVDCRHRIN